MFKYEQSQLWSYWTKFHEIFTQYRGIIYAVNAHIVFVISHSVSEWQSDKCRGVGNFAPFLPLNWLPWQRPSRYRKEGRIDHLQFNTYHMVERLWKLVQQILRYFVSERTRMIRHKIGCHGNVPWGIGKNGPDWQHSHKYLPFGEKIVKIGLYKDTLVRLFWRRRCRCIGAVPFTHTALIR